MPRDRQPSHQPSEPRSRHRRRSAHPVPNRRGSSHPRRQQSETLEALTRFVLRFTVQCIADNHQRQQQQQTTRERSSSSRRDRPRHPDPNAVARLLLAQLVQFLVHHYMSARHRRENSSSRTDEAVPSPNGPPGPGAQPLIPPTPGRPSPPEAQQLPLYDCGAVLSGRDIQALLTACDDLLVRLQNTEELVRRTMYRPASHEGCGYHRSIIENADALHVSIGSAAAGARRVREVVVVLREWSGGREGGRREGRGSAAEYYEGRR